MFSRRFTQNTHTDRGIKPTDSQYNGRPCKKCGMTLKYKKTKSCVICTRKRNQKLDAKRLGYQAPNKQKTDMRRAIEERQERSRQLLD